MKRSFVILAAVATASPVFAQKWTAQLRSLVESGRVDRALQLTWAQTAQGPNERDLNTRAALLDDLGLYHLAMADRADSLRINPRQTRTLDLLAQSALALDRFDGLPSVVQSLNNSRMGTASWPASMRAAWAIRSARFGRASSAATLLPSPGELGRIGNANARYQALLHSASIWAAVRRSGEALQSLGLAVNGRGGDLGLLRLQRARLFYEQRLYSEALQELVQLPRTSSSWYPGVLVGAWSAYMLGDYNLALGQLMTLNSPFLRNKFAPESHILEAAALFQLCQFQSAQTSLKQLKSKYEGVAGAASAFARRNGQGSARVSAVLEFSKEPLSVEREGLADRLVLDALLQEDGVAEASRSMAQLEKESAELERLFPSGGNAFLSRLRTRYANEIGSAKAESYRDALKAINARLVSLRADAATAFENSLAVDVEVNTRIRERLVKGRIPRPVTVDFEAEVKKGYEFWPYEGEAWRDEIGAYAFATSSVCGDQEL